MWIITKQGKVHTVYLSTLQITHVDDDAIWSIDRDTSFVFKDYGQAHQVYVYFRRQQKESTDILFAPLLSIKEVMFHTERY